MGTKKTITRSSSLSDLKGVGDKTAAVYKAKGIKTVGDLLDYYPKDYDYMSSPVLVKDIVPEQIQALKLHILAKGVSMQRGPYKVTAFDAADETGKLRLVFYNMAFLANTIKAGSVYIFRGPVHAFLNGSMELRQAAIFTIAQYDAIENTYQPRYSLMKGIANSSLIRFEKRALSDVLLPEDYLNSRERESLGLMEERDATQKIHFPKSNEDLVGARNRKVFDEFFSFILSIRSQMGQEEKVVNTRPLLPVAHTERLIEALPYTLTNSQKKAWEEIREDLSGSHVMNRLLQGDVGSGKTILAFLALLMCAANGRQGALMAPTEVLASQHKKDLQELVDTYHLPIHPVLLTGSVKGKERKLVLEEIENGRANVIIGTHALIQEKVVYKNLSLVITDEQHRFGVRQREALAGKGMQVPVLVMSATPIPRTLSIILYSDLKVSRLTELPANRLPIKNLASPSSDRGKIYRFVLGQIREGRQVYVICPAVEESEFLEVENVTDYTRQLRQTLPSDIRIESLNGRMKSAEKNRIMDAFARHDVDILVSTTVIEVGINVPNASVIVIENAERFGLSQLHQLRGRVGRGKWQSYCIFLYSDSIGQKPKRLQILEKTNDGFEIAEQDLKLRGPGDMFGTRQSGEMGFVLADIYEDADILQKASSFADTILERYKGKLPPAYDQIKSIDLRSI